MNTAHKRCPQCSQPAALDAQHCRECGHTFRTQFAPPANQTQMYAPAPPPEPTQFYQPPPVQQFPAPVAHPSTANGAASLVLGIVGMVVWCIPLLGLPVTVIGLTLGIRGLATAGRGMAVAGIALSGIGLFGTIVNAAIGAYQGMTGTHPLFPGG